MPRQWKWMDNFLKQSVYYVQNHHDSWWWWRWSPPAEGYLLTNHCSLGLLRCCSPQTVAGVKLHHHHHDHEYFMHTPPGSQQTGASAWCQACSKGRSTHLRPSPPISQPVKPTDQYSHQQQSHHKNTITAIIIVMKIGPQWRGHWVWRWEAFPHWPQPATADGASCLKYLNFLNDWCWGLISMDG